VNAVREHVAPARPPARAAGAPRRPPIAAVPRVTPARSRGFAVAAVLTVVALVVAVVFHVILAQGQLELDNLSTRIASAQRVYETRRLAVARLSAPERIIDAASRLGLVLPPDPPTYLFVPGAPTPTSGSNPSTTLGDWKQVKSHLGDPQP
jgi:hypothetical protein